jgi:hypothetical protein
LGYSCESGVHRFRVILGTLFGLAFHPIKKRMEHALRRYTNLDEMKWKWKWNAPTDADVLKRSVKLARLVRYLGCSAQKP